MAARSPALYAVLLREVTAAAVAHLFLAAPPAPGQACVRFALPGLLAVNFVLTAVLGGGGGASLRYDKQAKTFAQRLLLLPVRCPAALLPPLANL